MERTYDIFERLSDGTMLGVAAIDGHDEAILKLKWWGENRWNEFRLMHLASNSLVAAVNAPKRPPDQAVVEEKAARLSDAPRSNAQAR